MNSLSLQAIRDAAAALHGVAHTLRLIVVRLSPT